jgi:hypothetical protein
MEGVGTHHATTFDQRIVGQSLVQGRSVLLDRRCPLAPQLSRHATVCETEEVAFQSTIERMNTLIRACEPVAGTHTPLLLESWSCATCLWHAARERDGLITTGITSTRWLRVPDEAAPEGWRWHKRSDAVAGLSTHASSHMSWPRGGKPVCVPVVNTRVRTRYCCQVVIVRQTLDAPLSHTRVWASSDLEANPEVVLTPLSARWDIEVLFGDSKEALGLDQ